MGSLKLLLEWGSSFLVHVPGLIDARLGAVTHYHGNLHAEGEVYGNDG